MTCFPALLYETVVNYHRSAALQAAIELDLQVALVLAPHEQSVLDLLVAHLTSPLPARAGRVA